MKALEVHGLEVRYGEMHVLHDVDLDVEAGEIVCLLGRNGVGKTTLLRGILGLTPPAAGTITLWDQDITQHQPYEVVRRGVGYMPQEKGVFPDLSVRDNLRLGRQRRRNGEIPPPVLEVFPFLAERLDQRGGTLSGGEQKMLTLARLLIQPPALWLLDEPTEGLQPSNIKRVEDLIRTLNLDQHVSILLVEQNLEFAFKLAHRFFVLEKGHIADQGRVSDLDSAERVRKHLVI
ncbi:MAG: ABC transporter ATP-binding protein [Anaerolineae bacterium]